MSGRPDFHSNGAKRLAARVELIPANTLAKVRLTVRPGGAGPDGWSTQSRSSDALYLNTEALILEGPYAKRHVCARIGIKGKSVNEHGEDIYANRGRSLIRGILESARGVHPDDASDRARAGRTVRSLGERAERPHLRRQDRRRPRPPGSERRAAQCHRRRNHACA